MHLQSQHGIYLSNLISKLTVWNIWVLTTETSGRWWMRRFCSSIMLHVPTKKCWIKVLMTLLIFLERIQTIHIDNWSLQPLLKLLWKWQCPLWSILHMAWDEFATFHWGSCICCLSNHLQASRNRIYSAVLVMWRPLRMGSRQILVAYPWRKRPFCTHLQSFRRFSTKKFGHIKRNKHLFYQFFHCILIFCMFQIWFRH